MKFLIEVDDDPRGNEVSLELVTKAVSFGICDYLMTFKGCSVLATNDDEWNEIDKIESVHRLEAEQYKRKGVTIDKLPDAHRHRGILLKSVRKLESWKKWADEDAIQRNQENQRLRRHIENGNDLLDNIGAEK